MNNNLTEFSSKALNLMRQVPKGKVATYGLIADLAGSPRKARQVGWLLHSGTEKHKLPWHRIIKSGGLLSFPKDSAAYLRQKELLELEGIVVLNGRVNLRTYLWINQS